MSVQLKAGPAFEASRPEALFETPAVYSTDWKNIAAAYVASPDGQRFLINVPVEETPSPVTVVVNWTAALPR